MGLVGWACTARAGSRSATAPRLGRLWRQDSPHDGIATKGKFLLDCIGTAILTVLVTGCVFARFRVRFK